MLEGTIVGDVGLVDGSGVGLPFVYVGASVGASVGSGVGAPTANVGSKVGCLEGILIERCPFIPAITTSK